MGNKEKTSFVRTGKALNLEGPPDWSENVDQYVHSKMMPDSIKLNAFGRYLVVERVAGRWQVFDAGNDGMRRPPRDIVIPPDVALTDRPGYIDDLLHEWATPAQPRVEIIG